MRSPRVPLWLVGVFAEADQREAILGDFHEEFATIAAARGAESARRWCWRQAGRTIVHLVTADMRKRPVMLAVLVVGGYDLLSGAVIGIHYAVDAMLGRWQVYSYVDAYSFWLIYSVLFQTVLAPMLVGSLLATAAKGREVLTAVSLAALLGLVGGVGLARWALTSAPVLPRAFLVHQFEVLGAKIVLRVVSLLAGGLLVQSARSAAALRPSRAS